MIVAGTGHRPDKLGGYGDDVLRRLYGLARSALGRRSPTKVISGMALGWDTALALAALQLGIPLIAAVPFDGYDAQWPEPSRRRYRTILERATSVCVVSSGGYHPAKMQVRNEWMVDRCDKLLALWNGSSGGTANCLTYARRRRDATGLFEPVEIENLWSDWLRLS